MNELVNSNNQTMTSREIADLLESRHDHVKTSIDRLVKAGAISHPALEDGIKSANGVVVSQYRICKRDTYVIVAQLSPVFTARLVDRWQELENQVEVPQFAIPTTLSGALRLAAEQAETIEQQALQLEAAKPAIEFVDRFVDATGLKTFRQVCKLLGAKENDFRAFLMARNIMYRLGGEWAPYAQHIDAGRFEVKTGVSADSGHAFNSAKFTPKGVSWIAGEWAKFNIETVDLL